MELNYKWQKEITHEMGAGNIWPFVCLPVCPVVLWSQSCHN
jgi:hypothetical protein